MRFFGRFRHVVLGALVVAGLAYGCGRTSLDDGVISGAADGGAVGAAGHAGATGKGGAAGGGNPGLGGAGAVGIPCGATSCNPGTQACCTRFTGGQTTQSCVAANNPAACVGGSNAACVSSATCPSTQVCCVSINTLSSTCTPAAQCGNGAQFVLCTNDAGCPATLPSCCVLQAPAIGICVRRGTACTFPPGP